MDVILESIGGAFSLVIIRLVIFHRLSVVNVRLAVASNQRSLLPLGRGVGLHVTLEVEVCVEALLAERAGEAFYPTVDFNMFV